MRQEQNEIDVIRASVRVDFARACVASETLSLEDHGSLTENAHAISEDALRFVIQCDAREFLAFTCSAVYDEDCEDEDEREVIACKIQSVERFDNSRDAKQALKLNTSASLQ